jgi:hypothetical protein
VALLLGEASRETDQLAVARAMLAVLGELTRTEPLLLAIDDVQWLDPPTARMLEFAVPGLDLDKYQTQKVRH